MWSVELFFEFLAEERGTAELSAKANVLIKKKKHVHVRGCEIHFIKLQMYPRFNKRFFFYNIILKDFHRGILLICLLRTVELVELLLLADLQRPFTLTPDNWNELLRSNI